MDKSTTSLEAKTDVTASSGGHDISSQYEIPAPEPFVSFNALKDRIRHHYEICSDYYYSLW
jgi:tocopherol O-methyltransferase